MTHRRRGTVAVKGAASLRAGMQMVRMIDAGRPGTDGVSSRKVAVAVTCDRHGDSDHHGLDSHHHQGITGILHDTTPVLKQSGLTVAARLSSSHW